MSTHPCAICKGACCESLVFPANSYRPEKEFFRCRGIELKNGMFEVESRCPKLTPCGSCSIHDHRPAVCRYFTVGGRRCVETVNRRRHGEQRIAILNAIEALEPDFMP